MAIRIQKYQEQIGYETTNLPEVPHIQAVEGAFGGDVARGTQAIGKAVGDVAQVLQKHAVEQRQLQNDAFVASIDSEHTKAMQDALSDPTPETTIINGQKVTRPKGYLGRSGLNSIGSLGDFEKWHDTKAKSILDNIKDPATRLRVAKNIDSQYLSARGKVMEHEARETRSGYIKELESNRDLKISSTFNVSDVGKSLDEIAVLQNKINNAQGLDGATSQVELRKSVGSFVKNMVDTTLQADPTGDSSRALLANLSGRLGDDDNVQMNKYIDGEVKKNATVLLDDLNSKFIDGTITLEDIQSANRPKEKGGIGSASAMKMLKDLTKAQAEKLDSFRSDSAIAENYIQSVEAILFGQDSYKAKQILVDAFADGTMDREEAQKINRIKGILDRQKLTRDNDIRTNIPIIKNWFAANDNDKRELANTLSNYLTALDSGKNPEDARDEVLKAQYNKTYPQVPLGKDDKLNDPTRERQFVTMSPAERFGRGFSQGVAGTVEGFGGALRWLKQEELGKAVTDYAQYMKKFYAIPDPKFIDQVSAGFGSMATFFIPGMGITKGVQAATLFPRLAVWLGVGASTVLEATVEAGSVYEQAINKTGMSPKDAENVASKTFWTNIPMLAITNKLGIFGENGGKIARSLMASGFEGLQEFSQSVISNIALKDPTFQGAFESAAVGAIVGGGTKISVEAGSALKELAQAKEAMVKFQEVETPTVDVEDANVKEDEIKALPYEKPFEKVLRERAEMPNTIEVPSGTADTSGVAIPMTGPKQEQQKLIGYETDFQKVLRERAEMPNTIEVPSGTADTSGVAIPMTGPKQEQQKLIGYETDFQKVLRERQQMPNKIEVPKGKADFSGSAIPMRDLYTRQNDIKNLIDWESSQVNGGSVVSGGMQTGPERVVTYTNSGHSAAMQEIGPKESLRLLEKAYNGEKLTELQQNKVDMLLEDYRSNVKSYIEQTDKEIGDATKDLSESEATEVIDAFTQERETTEYDWDGNPIGPKEEVKSSTFGDVVNSVLRKLKDNRGSMVNPFQSDPSNPLNYKTAEEYVASKGVSVFHGSGTKFDSFDDSMRGSVTGAKSAKGAIWFTDNPKVAKAYSIYAAETGPVKALLDKADAQEKIAQKSGKKSDWDKHDDLLRQAEELDTYDKATARRELADVKEAVLNKDLNMLEVNAEGKTPQELSDEGDIDSWLNEQIKNAKKQGKDGLIIRNLDDAVGLYDVPSTHYAIFDSSKIKTKSQLTAEWEAAQKAKGSLSNERGSVVLPFPEVTIPEIATPKSLAKAGKDFNQFADASMVPLSTRLGRINESLRDALRKFEFNNGLSMHEDLNKALPFMEHMADMPETESAALDLALKNADRQTIEEIVNRNGIRQEYEDVRELLDGLYNRAKEVGLDVKYLDDYFPRRVENPEEFLNYLRNNENWSAIDKAIKQEETKIGSRLNNEERVEFINKLLRGYGNSQIRISKPSNIKSRKIQIIDEQMNAFYKNSTTTLQEYIVAMNKAIEAKKFFGMNGKDIENSIGSYVKDLVDSGMINHTQEREVADILKARFSERGTHGIWSFYKNLGYLYTMSSPISAITQIGDLSFALYENGFYSTAKGLGKAFSKNKITKQDLGIDVISDEFSDQSKSGEAVTKVFKLIGLEAFDNIGKETLINGAMDKLSRQARENNPKLTAELERVFGDEAQQTLQDLINQEPSVNVKYLLFSRLAKYQPIALSEMPEYYSKGGNLRIFYMLKSYTVKQIDAFNNEVFSQMQSNPKQAIKNLVRLSLALMTLNAGADVIKDVLLGRPTKASDLLVDNILRLFGFSKYTIYKAKREGLGEATMKTILPPIPFVDDLYKDIAKGENLSDYKLWNSIPFVGKFYYWWFGGGREYLDKKKRKRSKTRSDF